MAINLVGAKTHMSRPLAPDLLSLVTGEAGALGMCAGLKIVNPPAGSKRVGP